MDNCTPADLAAAQAYAADLKTQLPEASSSSVSSSATPPVINIWYESSQAFGQLGNPQEWINILGNVTPTVGVSLTYSLNGEPASPLSIGPDGRRLAAEGDFNVEIAYTDLLSGTNQVVITATDGLSNTSVETVTVQYTSGNVWPEPYAIDWASVTQIQDVAQIVDGQWALQPDGIRPAVMAYDRIVAIGDMTWNDYEVMVPITVHATDPAGYNPISNAPGVGLVMRWQGHTDTPVTCPQPHCGWLPLGASGWYDWGLNGGTFFIGGDSRRLATDATGLKLDLNTPYYWKMRVETRSSDQRTQYSFKVWKQADPEPSDWLLTTSWLSRDLPNGSLLLVAHHVDATFGDVIIGSGLFTDTTPPVITNIQATPGSTSATITWETDEPATSQVDYGLSPAYEIGTVSDSALVQQHAITLTNLTANTIYHYQITSADVYTNTASSSDLTFQTSKLLSTIVSDDFNTCGLNTGLWTFTDPLGGATLAIAGSHPTDMRLSISVPAGAARDIWTGKYFAPRILQPANDTDFEVEAKFASPLSARYQTQGIIVEQDSDNLLRLEFHSDGTNTRLFAAKIVGGVATYDPQDNVSIGAQNVAPLHMRVNRQGDQWTLSYSLDGQNWTTPISFSHALTVNSVGPYAGNSSDTGTNAPAHTGLIDYFFNTASPIVLEDGGQNTLTVNVVGNGTVEKSPNQCPYSDGQVVMLTPKAATGWTFTGWSGDLTGSANPGSVSMTGPKVVTATFALIPVTGSNVLYLPLVVRGQP